VRTVRSARDCFGNEEAHCVVDCDGGGVNLAMGPRPDTLLVRLRDNGIRMHGSCDDEKVVWLRPGSDDKVFRVDKVVLDQCRRLENDELGE
jgi:hypothetical protein